MGPVDTAAIVAVAVRAVTDGMVAASAIENEAVTATNIPGKLSLLKIIHLYFLYGILTGADIPLIWRNVHASTSK